MSTERGLIRLIKAKTGTLGTAGDSFSTDVVSTAGASMAEYKMSTASVNPWSNEPSNITTYANVHTFSNLVLTLSEYNARASEIQETTTNSWTVNYTSPAATATATLNSITWGSGVGTLNLTINGELTTGTPATSVVVWYKNFSPPDNYPWGSADPTTLCPSDPNCTTVYDVDFTLYPGVVAASGSTENQLSLTYIPDDYGAQFNPTVYGPGPSAGTSWTINQNRRAGATSTLDEIEWATDSGFSNIVSSSNPATIGSDNQTDVTYYLRYKLDGATSFTTWSIGLRWQDNRSDV